MAATRTPSAASNDADAMPPAERPSIDSLIETLGQFDGFPDRNQPTEFDVREPFDTEHIANNRDSVLTALADVRADLERRFAVRDLAIFGSAARDEMQPGSDVDILVEFAVPATFARYFALKDHLEALLGRPVDLVTANGLKPRAQRHVQRDLIRVA